MIQIGAFRAWMKKKIKDRIYEHSRHNLEGYSEAMSDVAEYHGFPLDDREWEKWSP